MHSTEVIHLDFVFCYCLSIINATLKDCRNVNLHAEEYVSDINNITSVLKLWFRELPDPLFPRAAYQHFLNAASKCFDNQLSLIDN
jgi:hypothetical protein